MGHRIGAALVTAALVWLITKLVRFDREASRSRLLAAFACTTTSLVFLGLAHAIGSTRGVLPGAANLAVAAVSGFVAIRMLREIRGDLRLLSGAIVVAALLLVQLALGVLTVLLRKPADVASAHVAVGALTLVTTFVLTVRSVRLFGRRAESCDRRLEEPDESMEAALAAA
jgi:heme A synthase